jgi:pectin methylesterase-like acyl-CoA thioesterase
LIGAGRDITTVQAVQGRNYKGGGNQSPVVMITGNEILDGIIISGFTFQGHIPEANPGNPTGVFNGWGNSGINGLSTHGILSFDMNDTSIWPPTERYNITITNNKFVYCGGVDLYNVTGFEISNNIMVRESHQIPYYVGDERYHDKANGGGIAYLSNCKDGLIENNEGYTPKDTGVITITGGSDIDVAGNCIIAAETLPGDTGFSCAGIRVWSNAQNIEVRENTVKGFIDDPEKQNYYGAAILVDNSSCEVTGNVLEDNDYGVMVGKTSVEQNVEFTGNTISGCALGVLLTDKCAETVPQVFSGNTFEDNAVHVQDDRTTTPDNYLEDLLENNTFPDGSQVIGSRIMVIEEGKAYNATTGNKYDTIQEAIDAAQAGETILVLSGTYDENITIKRSVKLHGANEGINPNKPDWTQAERKTETVLTGFITADVNVEHIEINGFKFTKGENGEGGALDFTLGGHSTVKIYNCIAEDTYANAEHRGSGFMYVTNHGTGSPRNGTVEFVNNRLINTHGSNAAGTSGVLIWNTDDIKANGNYFFRTDENTGMTSNAALNLLGQDGAMEIKDNCFEDLIIKLDGTNFAADSITGNIFTGREGKSNILEFTTIRTPEEIEFLAENNTYSPEGLGYVAMEPVRLGNKGYTTIQAAINAATDGDNIIKVYPGDYGTAPIEIVQKEGINITLQAVGDVDLKNQIKIDGEARYNGDESLTIKGFTFNFSDLSGEIITTFKSDNRIVNNNSTYVYAHNIFIEDCTFIGNPNADELDVVAVKAAAGGGHKNFEIRNCTGESLHSLAQLTSVNGLTVENCYVSKGESGLNLQNSLDISITNLNVDGTNYGVRAGDGKSTDLNDTTMTIKDSNLKALYPIWLRY